MSATRKIPTNEAGYSLLELLVSAAIMLAVTGAIFQLMNPSQGISQTQPEVADMQQRLRVATDMMYKDLVMAGAGPYQGATTGSLMSYFTPVLPYRAGALNNDAAAGVYYRPDAITLVYVPNTASQTTIRTAMPQPSSEIKVNPQPNCPPDTDDLCGFTDGMSLLIFDNTGAWDSFEVFNVQSSALHMNHRGYAFQKAYDVGANIVQAEFHTYYLDTATNQLMHYDGLATELPVADDVVGLSFQYYGDPNPPLAPKPVIGVANCLFDTSGNSVLPTLPATSGSLVELTGAMLSDGPWCGVGGSSQFDADLFRVRKVRVTVRTQAGDARFRGVNTTLFAQPGTSRGGERFIPDFAMSFEVSPRNLNLSR